MKKIALFSACLMLGLVQPLWAKNIPEKQHEAQLRLINAFLSQHHYRNEVLNDEKSKAILDKYLEFLDPSKQTFTQVDVQEFKKYQNVLDDLARKGNLSVPFDIYDKYTEKRLAQIDWALKRLDTPFPEDATGSVELDRKKLDWVADDAALQKRWEDRVLNDWITLRLAKQSDEKARETLKKRYRYMAKFLKETKNDDIFQLYANAITSVYDPHTNYFSPQSSEDFEINMSLSLEGIGAQLSLDDDVVMVHELIAGGPAANSGQLARNDKIYAVGQGDSGPMEDVVGWRLSDVVKLVRGKRGTKVRLRVEKAISNEMVDIVLVRDKINLEKSAAKSEIKTIEKEGKKYRVGIIDLPSFYIDFEGLRNGKADYRSSTRDMQKEIEKLKKEKVDGLLIDLRNNGGGSLEEVVKLLGLFIDKGPVVQVRRSTGDIDIRTDDDGLTLYDGPLAVLINEHSASASEIFAGAIKDYGRGLILGEPTFGKGTVQSIIDLENFLPNAKPQSVGQLKMTIAMFYRINGSSTQQKGVRPDIYIPDASVQLPGGESEEPYALPWHKINASKYHALNQVQPILPVLDADYHKAHDGTPLMENLLTMFKWQKQQSDKTSYSLNFKTREKEREAQRAKGLEIQNEFRKLYHYPLISADYWSKLDKDKSDSEIEAEKNYEIDAVLDLAVDTTADYIRLLKAPTKPTEMASHQQTDLTQ